MKQFFSYELKHLKNSIINVNFSSNCVYIKKQMRPDVDDTSNESDEQSPGQNVVAENQGLGVDGEVLSNESDPASPGQNDMAENQGLGVDAGVSSEESNPPPPAQNDMPENPILQVVVSSNESLPQSSDSSPITPDRDRSRSLSSEVAPPTPHVELPEGEFPIAQASSSTDHRGMDNSLISQRERFLSTVTEYAIGPSTSSLTGEMNEQISRVSREICEELINDSSSNSVSSFLSFVLMLPESRRLQYLAQVIEILGLAENQ
ncbi:uncharacterized protein LOC135844048 isoform X2 [Planococcus citri]|uniref:uncharacterized protein LOC135844048 isoform X2 n=1 Tax=Planococcus citri TaxID=170843 RepID=UPI0031F725C3